MTIQDVKSAQPEWFSRANMKFFGDVSYRILQGKKSKKFYLVRKTAGFSDMFGQEKTYHYVINDIDQDSFKVLNLLYRPNGVEHERFRDIDAVKEYLKYI